jgi:membrane-associated phospholipid phosphatase
MKTLRRSFIILAFLGICSAQQVYPQSSARDSTFRPYRVNYWVTGSIIGVGLTTNYLGVTRIFHKEELSRLEIEALNKNIIYSIDNWALTQDPSRKQVFANYSDYAVVSTVVLPVFLLFDKKISKDWFDVLLMYVETMSITPNIYEWSPLGPTFQNRIRPLAYYDQLTYDQRKSGGNRNSFYSGHDAVVAASTFFMVKVYSDYNPEIGNTKYLLYGAATIPPLLMGYFRVKALAHFPSDVLVGLGVGALCGFIIPELHRFQDKNISLGLYSSAEGTGITLKWQPEFLR